ncbi:hypothetical protein DL95DRAFT_391951, partial [Leptodontidium sp. 2 PMI_412]
MQTQHILRKRPRPPELAKNHTAKHPPQCRLYQARTPTRTPKYGCKHFMPPTPGLRLWHNKRIEILGANNLRLVLQLPLEV